MRVELGESEWNFGPRRANAPWEPSAHAREALLEGVRRGLRSRAVWECCTNGEVFFSQG